MEYKPRLTPPDVSNKYYKHTSAGGVNECILIKSGSCLPNCVGYAWGRFYEISGTRPKLSRRNAEEWYLYKEDGYKRGFMPKLGSVICWCKGIAGNSKDGAGHCAIVEKISSNGTITISQSDYYGSQFQVKTLSPPYVYSSSMTLQGFIYQPNDYTTENKKSITEIAKEVIAGKWGNGTDRKKRLVSAGYDYNTVQSEVNRLLNIKTTSLKSNEAIAKEVIQGKWGNGAVRKTRLENAGYNYNAIQSLVNKMIKG